MKTEFSLTTVDPAYIQLAISPTLGETIYEEFAVRGGTRELIHHHLGQESPIQFGSLAIVSHFRFNDSEYAIKRAKQPNFAEAFSLAVAAGYQLITERSFPHFAPIQWSFNHQYLTQMWLRGQKPSPIQKRLLIKELKTYGLRLENPELDSMTVFGYPMPIVFDFSRLRSL